MLVLSSSLKLVALAASLLASMPLASADLRQGPTGIEHVKRFQPSTAANPCPYVCPTYVSTAQQVQSGAPATLEPYKIAGAPVSGSTTQTLCQYSFGLNTPVKSVAQSSSLHKRRMLTRILQRDIQLHLRQSRWRGATSLWSPRLPGDDKQDAWLRGAPSEPYPLATRAGCSFATVQPQEAL